MGSESDREKRKTLEATVVELLPGAMVRVRLQDGEELTAHVAEEFRRVSAPVKPGDRVSVKRAERDPKRGAILSKIS